MPTVQFSKELRAREDMSMRPSTYIWRRCRRKICTSNDLISILRDAGWLMVGSGSAVFLQRYDHLHSQHPNRLISFRNLVNSTERQHLSRLPAHLDSLLLWQQQWWSGIIERLAKHETLRDIIVKSTQFSQGRSHTDEFSSVPNTFNPRQPLHTTTLF